MPKANPWTAASDLLMMTGASNLDEALRRSGMIDRGSGYSIEQVNDWWRGGAETYCYTFDVCKGKERICRAIVKACVTIGGGTLSDVVEQWTSRREAIAMAGISVPKLYCRKSGTLFEEFIAYDFWDRVGELGHQEELLKAAAFTGGRLTALGFMPLSIGDWRSRGLDAVIVDFGFDIGEGLASEGAGPQTLSEIVSRLEASCGPLGGPQLQIIEHWYARGREGDVRR